MQKCSQGFSWLTYVEPNHHSDEDNQAGENDFQCLIWIWFDLDILNVLAISGMV